MRELSWGDIAERLKTLRKKNRLTIERLAEMVNVSTSFIGLIEKGGSGISLENLYKLSQVYNCSLDFIITGKENNEEQNPALSRLATALYGYTNEEIELFAETAKFLRGKIAKQSQR